MSPPSPALPRPLRDALRGGAPARLDLPDGGRAVVDYGAPVLVVHRCGEVDDDDPARDARAACAEAHRLATSAPAYVLSTGADVGDLVVDLSGALAEAAGAVLVLEVWAPLDLDGDEDVDPFDRRPGFTLYVPGDESGPVCDAAEALCDALTGIEVAGQGADVETVSVEAPGPPGFRPLLPAPAPNQALIGLAVDAVFVNGREGEFYPRVLEALREALAPALDVAAWTFARGAGAATPAEPAGIGRRHLEPAAVAVDRGLGACEAAFGFLLQVTPVNSRAAWQAFQDADGEQAPEFLYRPLTFDPDAVRRELFALRLDAVEDPVVAGLLRERRDETDAKLRMVLDIETPQFLPGSLAVYGAPDEALTALARDVLAHIPPSPATGSEVVGPTVFAAEARAEVEHFRAQWDGVGATVEIREDLPGSLMVSQGQLLIGGGARVPAHRVRALLAHEVGTHVLTYYNGSAQPLRQLQHGLADYEGLQEGIAVLSEWLVGGLTGGRMRTLAARVLGARALADGASFVETVRALRSEAGLSQRAAFNVALRLYRGGGLTKDLIYLRGLRDLLAHLGDGGEFWPLLAGKMALRHVPALRALRERGVLRSAPLRPRWAEDDRALARLARTATGLTVLDLLREAPPTP